MLDYRKIVVCEPYMWIKCIWLLKLLLLYYVYEEVCIAFVWVVPEVKILGKMRVGIWKFDGNYETKVLMGLLKLLGGILLWFMTHKLQLSKEKLPHIPALHHCLLLHHPFVAPWNPGRLCRHRMCFACHLPLSDICRHFHLTRLANKSVCCIWSAASPVDFFRKLWQVAFPKLSWQRVSMRELALRNTMEVEESQRSKIQTNAKIFQKCINASNRFTKVIIIQVIIKNISKEKRIKLAEI